MADAVDQPVLILGGGINGCALARELAINGVPVSLVDKADISTGATAGSSRLIHGGLRYLEYGDVRLVRESLAERERLLRLAPQFVQPLALHIPIRQRCGGLLQSLVRFLRLDAWRGTRWIMRCVPKNSVRGLTVVRLGLGLYDWLARSQQLPGHSVLRVGSAHVPMVDPAQYRWVCTYYDAQMLYPERFALALLADAQADADRQGIPFEVLTHHRAEISHRRVRVFKGNDDSQPVRDFRPAAIVNATGAWGDLTLADLKLSSPQLIGGTKGSHILTDQPALRSALGHAGVYAEAADGRLAFILPLADHVLVGTTDIRFHESPDLAIAEESEVLYLVGLVNEVFADVALTREDVFAHYCGVRPLPYVPEGKTSSIPRGHWVHESAIDALPLYTLIGGKLTTCRAFAEEAADRLFAHLGVQRAASSRDRPVPGSDGAPEFSPMVLAQWCRTCAQETGFTDEQIAALWPMVGTRVGEILSRVDTRDRSSIAGTSIPRSFVDWSIQHEWSTRLNDVVIRRLMLGLHPHLRQSTLADVADRLIAAGHLTTSDRDAVIDACIFELRTRHGLKITY